MVQMKQTLDCEAAADTLPLPLGSWLLLIFIDADVKWISFDLSQKGTIQRVKSLVFRA